MINYKNETSILEDLCYQYKLSKLTLILKKNNDLSMKANSLMTESPDKINSYATVLILIVIVFY